MSIATLLPAGPPAKGKNKSNTSNLGSQTRIIYAFVRPCGPFKVPMVAPAHGPGSTLAGPQGLKKVQITRV
jgi:hypothetical protein